MANDATTRLARHIVDDFTGNGYYLLPGELAKLLGNGMNLAQPEADELASAILSDWQGARYYGDPEALAQYLESRSAA